MGLRSFLDDIAPSFEKGGKFEALYPAYEAVDTALYTPSVSYTHLTLPTKVSV